MSIDTTANVAEKLTSLGSSPLERRSKHDHRGMDYLLVKKLGMIRPADKAKFFFLLASGSDSILGAI